MKDRAHGESRQVQSQAHVRTPPNISAISPTGPTSSWQGAYRRTIFVVMLAHRKALAKPCSHRYVAHVDSVVPASATLDERMPVFPSDPHRPVPCSYRLELPLMPRASPRCKARRLADSDDTAGQTVTRWCRSMAFHYSSRVRHLGYPGVRSGRRGSGSFAPYRSRFGCCCNGHAFCQPAKAP